MPRRDGPGRETLIRLHHVMRLTRSVEERLASLYRQGKIAGSLFRSLGQEAASVAPAVALEEGDLIAPLFRDLGALLARGFTPRECFAQYLGRAAGPTGGREAAHHMGDVAGRGVVAAISSLGETVCVMAGCALGLKLRGSDRVCLTWIGDGGTSTGAFHEGMNFAAVRRLPLIVVIENNGFAYSTPGARQTRQGDFTVRGTAYGCAGVGVDGNDAAELHDAVRAAAARARAGGGPTVIEARTFRLVGHAEHDDASYLPPELVKEWKDKDPIRRIEERLVAGRVRDAGRARGDGRPDREEPRRGSRVGGILSRARPRDGARRPLRRGAGRRSFLGVM